MDAGEYVLFQIKSQKWVREQNQLIVCLCWFSVHLVEVETRGLFMWANTVFGQSGGKRKMGVEKIYPSGLLETGMGRAYATFIVTFC